MKLLFVAQFLSLLSLAFAFRLTWPGKRDDDATTTTTLSAKPTTVWVTITTNGVVATVKSYWTQSFMSTFTATTSEVQAGSIGMGSLSGSAGSIRSYSQTTISNEGQALVYSGAFGMFAVLAGILI